MKRFDVITIGSATRDSLAFVPDALVLKNPKKDIKRKKLLAFEYGAKIYIKDVFQSLGGGAANTAVCFSRLGFRAATIAYIGDDDNGQAVINGLNKEKVATSLIKKQPGVLTAFSLIMVTQGGEDRTILAHRGVNDLLSVSRGQLSGVETKWFYLASLGSNWRSIMDLLLSKVKSGKVKLAWNPNIAQLQKGPRGLSKYLKQTEILLLNKDEAIELVLAKPGKKKSLSKPKDLLETIKGFGPAVVVITDGVRGAWVFDGKKHYYSKTIKTKAADVTGAGDAFGSTFTFGYHYYKGDIKKALQLAIVNSNHVITQVGAQHGLLSLSAAKRRTRLLN